MHAAHGKYFFSLLLFGSNGIVASAILLSSQEIVLLRTLLGSLCLCLELCLEGFESNPNQGRLLDPQKGPVLPDPLRGCPGRRVDFPL